MWKFIKEYNFSADWGSLSSREDTEYNIVYLFNFGIRIYFSIFDFS